MSAAKCSAGCIDMSRIGKKVVEVPNGVTLTLDGQTVTVKGPSLLHVPAPPVSYFDTTVVPSSFSEKTSGQSFSHV